MEFNINNYVDVKLNEIGIAILEKRNAELRSRIPSFPVFAPPETDQNGFSRWQLWELMEQFGPHISLGSAPPFDTVILIDDSDEITTLRQQLTDAKEENEQVRQANLDVIMHFEDMKAAKEKAEAQVAAYATLTDSMDAATRYYHLSGPAVVRQFKRLKRPQPPVEQNKPCAFIPLPSGDAIGGILCTKCGETFEKEVNCPVKKEGRGDE